MANPSTVTLINGTITKVAENVLGGYLNSLNKSTNYFTTFRLTGEAAPTYSAFKDECIKIFQDSDQEEIGHDEAIDIYVLAEDNTGLITNGKISVWV